MVGGLHVGAMGQSEGALCQGSSLDNIICVHVYIQKHISISIYLHTSLRLCIYIYIYIYSCKSSYNQVQEQHF